MIFKTVLTFLAVGALSVNALTVPVARSPAPEPECEFSRSFSTTSYRNLTLVSSKVQELNARHATYDLFSRELQALNELFSREPEWVEYMAKRQGPGTKIKGNGPTPINTGGGSAPRPRPGPPPPAPPNSPV